MEDQNDTDYIDLLKDIDTNKHDYTKLLKTMFIIIGMYSNSGIMKTVIAMTLLYNHRDTNSILNKLTMKKLIKIIISVLV